MNNWMMKYHFKKKEKPSDEINQELLKEVMEEKGKEDKEPNKHYVTFFSCKTLHLI